MSISFDGATKLATLSAGTTNLSVRDLWSRWVDWWLTDNNSGIALLAMSQVGGDDIDISAGTSIPIFIFLTNGWRVKPQEAHHTLTVADGILLVDGGGDPFVNTTGSYIVRINYQQPVQAIGFNQGAVIAPTQQQIRDAMTLASAEPTADGSIDSKIDGVSVVAVGAALNIRADSFVRTTGTVVSGTYLDTYDANEVYHRITHDAGAIDVEYELNVGADYVPVSVAVIGRMHGPANNAQIQAYHWGDQVFRQVGTMAGKTQDVTISSTLFVAHVGSGGDAGRVRIRFVATGVNNDLYIDQFWVSYAPSGAFNSSDRTTLNKGLTVGQFLALG